MVLGMYRHGDEAAADGLCCEKSYTLMLYF
jgi:hypothetical protein